MKKVKKVGLLVILSELKSGLNQKQISEKYSVPKQTISYSVDKLKKMKCVEKIGHGVSSSWKWLKDVQVEHKDTSEVKTGLKEIRGHAFMWNIEFLEEDYDWMQIIKNYKKRYKRPKLNFKMICNGKVPRTIFKNRKIWLTKSGLTIYESLNFLGKSSFNVKGNAVFEMDRLIKSLIKEFRLRMQNYRFKCSREHFAHVNNQMARQFNDRKQKIKVECDGKWFWIDFSDGINEEETDDANISVQAQKYYHSQVKTGFKYTPEVLEDSMEKRDRAIQKNAENLDYHAENMKSHVGVVRELGIGVKALVEEVKEMRKQNERKKFSIKRLFSKN